MLPYFRIEVILFIAGLCLFLALFDKLLKWDFYLYNINNCVFYDIEKLRARLIESPDL